MDPRWLPWCWAAGAAGCAIAFFLVQPWRGEFQRGILLVRKYPGAWAVPSALLGCDALAAGWAGKIPDFPAGPAMPRLAGALLQAWHGFHFGAAVALLAGLLLAVDFAGLRRGFVKGAQSVTGGAGMGPLVVVLMGVAALLADAALAGQGVPAVWHAAVTILAIPLLGWSAAAVLAGLLLLAETECRAPSKGAGVRWFESAAAHSARLWPWAMAHGLIWWLGRWIPREGISGGQWILCALGLVLAFAPLLFLHVKQGADWRGGGWQALMLWPKRGWQPVIWLGVTGMGFQLWDLAGQGLAQWSIGGPAPLRILLACGHTLVQIGLTVVALGAWVALRSSDDPPPRPRRPRPAKKP